MSFTFECTPELKKQELNENIGPRFHISVSNFDLKFHKNLGFPKIKQYE